MAIYDANSNLIKKVLLYDNQTQGSVYVRQVYVGTSLVFDGVPSILYNNSSVGISEFLFDNLFDYYESITVYSPTSDSEDAISLTSEGFEYNMDDEIEVLIDSTGIYITGGTTGYITGVPL
jgi:hypothetical protein